MKTLFSKLVAAVALCATLVEPAMAARFGNPVPLTSIISYGAHGTFTNADFAVSVSNITTATTTQNVYVALMYHDVLYWSTGSGWTTDVSAGYPVYATFTGDRFAAYVLKSIDLSKLDTTTVKVGEGVIYFGFGADINDMLDKGQLWSVGSLHGMGMVLPR